MLERNRALKPKIAIKILSIPNHNYDTPMKPIPQDDMQMSPHKKPLETLRKSHSKQEFRRPIINSSKLPQGFFSTKKPASPAFSNSPLNKEKGTPGLKHQILFLKNPVLPLKQFLELEKRKELELTNETPKASHFLRKYNDCFHRSPDLPIDLKELIGIRVLSKAEKSRKRLVFHAKSLKLYVLEEYFFPSLDLYKEYKTQAEKCKEISLENVSFVRILQVFCSVEAGICGVLKEFMSGGGLQDLIAFSGVLNERSIQSILMQFEQIAEGLNDEMPASEPFFDKRGNMKLNLKIFGGILRKKDIKAEIREKCLFGDLFKAEIRRKSEKKLNECCLIHELINEDLLANSIFSRHSEAMQAFFSCQEPKKPFNFFKQKDFQDADVDLKDLLRLSLNYSRKTTNLSKKERNFQKILNEFCLALGNTQDLYPIIEKINQNSRFVKEISATFDLQPSFVASKLKLIVSEAGP